MIKQILVMKVDIIKLMDFFSTFPYIIFYLGYFCFYLFLYVFYYLFIYAYVILYAPYAKGNLENNKTFGLGGFLNSL